MVKPNPAHLQTFAVVAETGNLTQAGLLLDLSQSAISSQLKQLQSQMGEALYRRSGHGVTLTQAGESLLPYAQEIARQVNLAHDLMQLHRMPAPKPVRIGLCLTLGETLPALILQKCALRCPDIQVDVMVAPTPDLARAVESGELPLAFAGGAAEPAPLALHPLKVQHIATDRLVWVAPQGAPASAPTLREAARFPWLWAHAGSTVKSTVERAAQMAGLELPPARILGSYAAVRSAVQGGLGGAFFPLHHLLQHGEGLRGVELTDVDLRLAYQSISTSQQQSEMFLRVKQTALSVLDETLGQP